ncbi:MAG: glycosyltransferase family 39 protein [Planctomycetota bacterium]
MADAQNTVFMKPLAPLRRLGKWLASPIGVIVSVSFLLRVVGISWGLPQLFFYHDEMAEVNLIVKIFRNLNFDAGQYYSPTGFPYLATPFIFIGSIITVVFTFGHYLFLLVVNSASLATFWEKHPIPLPGYFQSGWDLYPDILWWARFFSASVGTGTVYLGYRLTRDLCNERSALLTALFLACESVTVRLSHFARQDMLFLFFTVWGMVMLGRIMSRGKTVDFLLCGFMMGLASAVKYWGIILLPAILWLFVDGVINERWKWYDFRLACCGASSLVGLFLLDPGVILHPILAREGIRQGMNVVFGEGTLATAGMTTPWISILIDFLLHLGTIPILAVVGAVYYARRNQGIPLVIILSPGVTLLLMQGSCSTVDIRYHTPMIVSLIILAAIWIDHITAGRIGTWRSVWGGLATLVLAWPLLLSVVGDEQLVRKESRVRVREWALHNLQAKDYLFADSYCGQLAPVPGKTLPYRALTARIQESPDFPLEKLRAMGVTHVAISSMEWFRYEWTVQGKYADRHRRALMWYHRLRKEATSVAVFAPESAFDWVPLVGQKFKKPNTPTHLDHVVLYGNPLIEVFRIH